MKCCFKVQACFWGLRYHHWRRRHSTFYLCTTLWRSIPSTFDIFFHPPLKQSFFPCIPFQYLLLVLLLSPPYGSDFFSIFYYPYGHLYSPKPLFDITRSRTTCLLIHAIFDAKLRQSITIASTGPSLPISIQISWNTFRIFLPKNGAS